jgi:tripeptidyl-peptidase-1
VVYICLTPPPLNASTSISIHLNPSSLVSLDVMKVSLLALTVGLVAYASAAPAKSAYVVHEKRETQHQQWSRRDVQLNRDAVIPLSIGLAQQNLDKGYEFLMDVSHPESPNYGKHWSMEKAC